MGCEHELVGRMGSSSFLWWEEVGGLSNKSERTGLEGLLVMSYRKIVVSNRVAHLLHPILRSESSTALKDLDKGNRYFLIW